MNKKCFFIILASLIISFMFLNKNVSAAASNSAAAHSYDIQLFSENQNFNMPKSAASYFLNIPKDAVLNNDCYVTIHYAISNTLISNLSNISLSVNGVPIDTEWICNIQKTSPNYWKVSIPIDKLKVGAINEIRIESDHRSIIGDCADIDNPGNWVTIYNDSKIHISDKSLYSPTLSDFYSSYFEDFGSKQYLTSNFVLPKVKNNDLISDLLKLSSSIGSLYSDRNLINYNVGDNLNQQSTANSILIAPIDKLKENKNLNQNQGFLSISNKSQENPYYNTVISGENQEGINKAANFICNNSLLKQIKDNSLTVDSKVSSKYNKFIQNKKGLYRFSDWGYSDVNLAGAFHQRTSFSFVQPNGVQAGSGSYINLKFKHSKILLSDRSLLTIYIDGKVINNSKLSDSNAEDGSLKVQIPDSALKKPVIKVDIEVYNYIGKIDCSKDYYDSAWTYINSNSEVCLVPGRLIIQPSLDNFPYFNTYNENKQPKILMSFSKNINNDDLDTAAIIASRAGQNSKEVFDFDVLNGDSEPTRKQKDEDMIFIGSFNNIKLPDKIKNSIPIVPLGNNKFRIKDGIQVVPETLKNKTVVQVVRSPWNFYKRVYVITYDNSSNLKALKSVLSDTDNLKKIEGQVSVIDNKKGVNNISVSDSEDNKVPVTFSSAIQVIEDKSGFPWWALLIALILAGICIAAVIKLRKKSNQFEDAGDKMKKSQGFDKKN
ncbi:hypothetical protein J2Z42_002241 [Clostridium algifaecis]|uniref:Cellulose synthase n=1 Tax=Clostridium algifaecis TaxID=1472040 RepID=A0ABS4KTZ9_9CLOT|nr:hypothetical protein [Clostridium algifaecis]